MEQKKGIDWEEHVGVFTKNLLTVTDGMNPHCERLRSKLHKLQFYIITNQQDTGQEKQSSLGLILYLLLILFFFFFFMKVDVNSYQLLHTIPELER